MTLPLKLRITGWIVSLIGAAVLVFAGGFGGDAKNPVPWLGAITFVIGMMLTSSSGLAAHLQRMKALKQACQPPPDAPPEPPAKTG